MPKSPKKINTMQLSTNHRESSMKLLALPSGIGFRVIYKGAHNITMCALWTGIYIPRDIGGGRII